MAKVSKKALIRVLPKAASLPSSGELLMLRRDTEKQDNWDSKPQGAYVQEVNFKDMIVNLTQEILTNLNRGVRLEKYKYRSLCTDPKTKSSDTLSQVYMHQN